MLTPGLLLGLVLLGQRSGIEPAHAGNGVYTTLLGQGLTVDGTRLEFALPALHDGEPGAAQHDALVKIAGSPARLEELERDSVTAPFVLKVHDETTKGGDFVRRGDLFFFVHADINAVDPDDLTRRGADEKPVEAGNMRFVSHVLSAAELQSRALTDGKAGNAYRAWFVHVKGRLLDRIAVGATDRIVATRSDLSWVVASRTEPEFDADKEFPNQWRPLGGGETASGKPYGGGASYVKISKVAAPAGALFVESHFAFVEPLAWFDGAPILRSKFSPIAQDQIRRLRRDLVQPKSKSKSQ